MLEVLSIHCSPPPQILPQVIQYQWQHQQQLTPPRTETIPRFHGEAPIKPQVIPCNSFIMNLSQVRPSRLALCCHVMCRCACWMLSKNLCNLVSWLSPFVVWIKQPVLSTESFQMPSKKNVKYIQSWSLRFRWWHHDWQNANQHSS